MSDYIDLDGLEVSERRTRELLRQRDALLAAVHEYADESNWGETSNGPEFPAFRRTWLRNDRGSTPARKALHEAGLEES